MIDRSTLPNAFEFVAGSTPRVAAGDHKKTTIAC
jgi:hypothetical protein